MARTASLVGLLVVLVAAVGWWGPFLARDRDVATSTPSPGPYYSRLDVPLRPGSQACVARVPLDTATGRVRFRVAGRRPGLARVAIEAAAPGYRQRRALTVRLPRDMTPAPALAAIAPPPSDRLGTVCLRNQGDSPLGVYGTNEAPSIGLSQTSVDGRSLGATHGAELALFEARRASVLGRLGTLASRAADLTGGLAPAWLVWPLAVLLVAGAPLAVLGGLWLALRDEG
jgi:hypothetical protein